MISDNKYNSSLGLNTKNGLFFIEKQDWRKVLSFKSEQAIEKINPFAFFCFKNEPLILFFHNPENEKRIHQLCWNFNKAPIIIFFRGHDLPIADNGNELVIRLDEKIEIFNGFDLNESNGFLNPLSNADIKEFSYWNIVSGRIWEQYAFSFKNENKVDARLLENIGEARTQLIAGIKEGFEQEKSKEASIIVNRILGRLIFTRYLIDRKIKINFKQKDYLSKDDLTEIIEDKTLLYDLFSHLQDIFNGDLFPFVGDSKNAKRNKGYEKSKLAQTDLTIISLLFSGGEILLKQPSLFHLYDFSIIPIELVSNIYEYFMGKEKQDKNKAFYTPPFLVDYLVNETIEPFLEKQDTWYCTTLDPACGSGIFLVETLRRIIVKYKSLNNDVIKNNIKRFKYDIINILKDNIYGIDKDREALDVAIFSLYITLLDFIQEPKNIEGFRFPYLLGSNFFEADFFTTSFPENKENDFIEKLKRIKLDFIIGNPPWGRVKDSPYMDYSKERLKSEPEELSRLQKLFPINHKGQKRKIKLVENNEIAQAFLLRTSDFADKDWTTCALLVTSKVLHNLQSNVFRNYFFNKVILDKVVDFSAVSEHLFKQKGEKSNTLGPATFFVFNWNSKNQNNIIKHYSPKINNFFFTFNTIVIESFDNKDIPQSLLINNDWAWKVYLYGNKLDFKFIKYLKSNYKSINEVISKERFVKGRGVEPNGKTDKNTEHLQNAIFIDANKDIERFHIAISKDTTWNIGHGKNERVWDKKTAHRAKKDLFEQGLFDGNTLLINKGLNSKYFAVTAFTYEKAVFRDAISGIKAKFLEDIPLLKTLVGLLNSIFFSYYIFNIGSSTGIERKQVHNVEKFSMPAINNKKIADFVDDISKTKAQLKKIEKRINIEIFDEKEKLRLQQIQLENTIHKLELKIDKSIHNAFNFTNEEKALINYSQEISIPLFKGESKPFEKVNKSQLEIYAKVFQEYFSQVFNRPSKYFQVEVLESPFIIGIHFKIVENKPKKWFSYKEDKEQELILGLLSTIAFEQITDKVFIQKDVKIINKNSFSIIKPNEYKCWHEAIAYLDLDEFIPALTSTQKIETKA